MEMDLEEESDGRGGGRGVDMVMWIIMIGGDGGQRRSKKLDIRIEECELQSRVLRVPFQITLS